MTRHPLEEIGESPGGMIRLFRYSESDTHVPMTPLSGTPAGPIVTFESRPWWRRAP
jgi:hypothetical protein